MTAHAATIPRSSRTGIERHRDERAPRRSVLAGGGGCDRRARPSPLARAPRGCARCPLPCRGGRRRHRRRPPRCGRRSARPLGPRSGSSRRGRDRRSPGSRLPGLRPAHSRRGGAPVRARRRRSDASPVRIAAASQTGRATSARTAWSTTKTKKSAQPAGSDESAPARPDEERDGGCDQEGQRGRSLRRVEQRKRNRGGSLEHEADQSHDPGVRSEPHGRQTHGAAVVGWGSMNKFARESENPSRCSLLSASPAGHSGSCVTASMLLPSGSRAYAP